MSAHQQCMIAMLERRDGLTLGQEMGVKVNGVVEGADRRVLTSIILESLHLICYRLLGVEDMREETGDMPWVKPESPLCLVPADSAH